MGLTYNFADLLETLADAGPDRPMLIAPPVKLTAGQLDRRATRLANHLAGLGVGPGDHVAIHAMNRAEWFEALFACFKLRAVPINVNYRYVAGELRYLYDNADVVVSIIDAGYLPRLEPIRNELPRLRDVLVLGEDYERALEAASPERNFGPRSNDDVYMVFTGGTTGMPKGVMWRHEDAFFAVAGGGGMGGPPITSPAEIAGKASGTQVKMMATTPVMHGGAQWGAFFAIFSGNVSVIWTGKRYDPDAVLELVDAEGVNTLQIIGDAMGRPLAEALRSGRHSAATLFAVGNGGAPLSASVKAELVAAKPGLVISDSYGASETGAGGSAAFSPEGGPAKFAMSPQLTVLDDDLRPVAAGSGEVGKLARSGHIPLGYYRDPDKTAATFPRDEAGTRWVIPGDFATIEADGSIVVLGRGSQSINSGGEKIYPEEVESALRAHPDVYDAVVVGLPDARWGEKVTALVQLRAESALDVAALISHCRTELADYKAPKSIYAVDEVVHTPVGKLDYVWAKQAATTAESAS